MLLLPARSEGLRVGPVAAEPATLFGLGRRRVRRVTVALGMRVSVMRVCSTVRRRRLDHH
jgi:hypothetical protein